MSLGCNNEAFALAETENVPSLSINNFKGAKV